MLLGIRTLIGGVLCLCCMIIPFDAYSAPGAEVDRVHSNGKTALMLAAKGGNRARAEELIRAGADVNQANDNGGTPIMYAALRGAAGMVELLLRHGADADQPADNGWTALMIAAAKGYFDVADLLLNNGVKPDQADVYAWTPLMRAVFEGRSRIVARLLDTDAVDVDRPGENGRTALHLAVMRGSADIARQLLAAGADPRKRDNQGYSALDIARENNNLSAKQLIGTGSVH